MPLQPGSLNDRLKQLLVEAEQLGMMGSWELIHSTGELLWTDGTYRLFGTSPTRTPNYDLFLACVHPDDRERVDRVYQDSVSRHEPYEMRHRVLCPDGTEKVILGRGTTTYTADGEALRTVGIVQDITVMAAMEAELADLAFNDQLTLLPNRQAALQELERRCGTDNDECSLADVRGFGVFNLDLDGFQAINDSFGNVVGDQLLIAIAHRLRADLPENALCARLESDEFLVVLPGELNQLSALAQGIKSIVAPLAHTTPALPLIPSISIGVSHYPSHGTQPLALLQAANTALMEAKRRARGGLCLYSSSISDQIHQRVSLEVDLQRAIQNHDFFLVFHPQVDRQGDLIGAEVLLRWRNAQGVLIPPSVFIPLAEQSGLINRITDFVIEESCRQLLQWQQRGLASPRLAVNLSAVQLGVAESLLEHKLLEVIHRHGIEASAFEFEVTETALLEHLDVCRDQAQALVKAGFSLAIDDFGTGYGSMLTLRILPVKTIKIDRSFVQRMLVNPVDLSIVRRTIQLIHDLGMVAMAEGVETEAQRDALLALGCDAFQGYLFYQPMTAELFVETLLDP